MATSFLKLTELEETLGRAVVNAAYKVHKELGPGLLEKVYEVCLVHELRKAGFHGHCPLNPPNAKLYVFERE